ncbi:hypothetical protein HMPREF0185_00055 [Brevundimonas diminuta 470-4]|uniref:AAA+ ATPase domain-containing protein n=2 Tax=Brevundimonas TaxID=41275 RepID=A0A0B4BZN8_9CAUL|nr:hypothetical protein [Brevundimonas diminuta]EKY30795.1 hypothetical protein HMPREF0185_00055 [Brevundimonas diminuta 470-4]KIC54094.1 hypothetical protein RM53_16025 [Brevundimonas nasdae]MBK1976475.1 hypothetical protein [Brevundimonas diminuta]
MTKTKGADGTVRKTLEDWEAVPTTNPLCDDIDDAARKLGYVFDKTKTAETGAILCGQPGMGKSEAIRQALSAAGLKGLFFKHGDQRQLLDAFEMAHRNRQPLILEEADNVLKSEGQANILKEAMDQAGNRVWTTKRREPDEDGKLVMQVVRIPLTAPLVLTSNKDLRDDRQFEPKMRPHVSALRSRVAPLYIGADRLTAWEYSCYLAICQRMLHKPDERTSISPAIQDRALEWFTVNLLRLEDGSPRTLKAVAKFISYNPEQPRLWAKDMKAMLVSPDQPDFIPPGGVMPRIFLDRMAKARMSLRRAA